MRKCYQVIDSLKGFDETSEILFLMGQYLFFVIPSGVMNLSIKFPL